MPTLQFYKQDYEALTRMALNLAVAERIIAEHPNKKCIVYAPACFLDEEYVEEKQIRKLLTGLWTPSQRTAKSGMSSWQSRARDTSKIFMADTRTKVILDTSVYKGRRFL